MDIFNHYDGIQFVQNDDRNIFVAEEYILSYFRILYAQKPLLIGSEYLSMDAVAMSFPKQSPLYKSFNYQ